VEGDRRAVLPKPGDNLVAAATVPAILSGAAAGVSPIALQARAGHSNFGTTKRYLMLAGVGFEEETAKHSERLWGAAQ
jgi:hypothetical protein